MSFPVQCVNSSSTSSATSVSYRVFHFRTARCRLPQCTRSRGVSAERLSVPRARHPHRLPTASDGQPRAARPPVAVWGGKGRGEGSPNAMRGSEAPAADWVYWLGVARTERGNDATFRWFEGEKLLRVQRSFSRPLVCSVVNRKKAKNRQISCCRSFSERPAEHMYCPIGILVLSRRAA